MDAASAEPKLNGRTLKRGFWMAHEEPLLTDPPTHDVAVHVEDYTRFTHLFKWGAISAFVIALFILIFVL